MCIPPGPRRWPYPACPECFHQKAGEEHHRHDEHCTGDDAHPRQCLEEPAGSSAIGKVAGDRRRGRRIGGRRRAVSGSAFSVMLSMMPMRANACVHRCVFLMNACGLDLSDLDMPPGARGRAIGCGIWRLDGRDSVWALPATGVARPRRYGRGGALTTRKPDGWSRKGAAPRPRPPLSGAVPKGSLRRRGAQRASRDTDPLLRRDRWPADEEHATGRGPRPAVEHRDGRRSTSSHDR